MLSLLTAVQNTKAFWYFTRGSGAVATLLLSVSVVLGIMTTLGWNASSVPRFLVQGLHRNVSLMVVFFIGLHVATTVIDGYVSIGWVDGVLPFHSGYKALWVGLGAIAFDLLLAVILSSLLRVHIKQQTWRLIHWLSYACWPIAMVHGYEIGSDRHAPWLIWVELVCVFGVVAAIMWRLLAVDDLPDGQVATRRRPLTDEMLRQPRRRVP